jgi:hypothetical protein
MLCLVFEVESPDDAGGGLWDIGRNGGKNSRVEIENENKGEINPSIQNG